MRRNEKRREEAPLKLGLSPRESNVIYWVVEGKTNREIATILEISSRTVQKHLEHIYTKLGVENRTAAAVRALSRRSATTSLWTG